MRFIALYLAAPRPTGRIVQIERSRNVWSVRAKGPLATFLSTCSRLVPPRLSSCCCCSSALCASSSVSVSLRHYSSHLCFCLTLIPIRLRLPTLFALDFSAPLPLSCVALLIILCHSLSVVIFELIVTSPPSHFFLPLQIQLSLLFFSRPALFLPIRFSAPVSLAPVSYFGERIVCCE